MHRCRCLSVRHLSGAVSQLLSQSEKTLAARDLDAILKELVVEISYGETAPPPGGTAAATSFLQKESTLRLRCDFSVDRQERRQLVKFLMSRTSRQKHTVDCLRALWKRRWRQSAK